MDIEFSEIGVQVASDHDPFLGQLVIPHPLGVGQAGWALPAVVAGRPTRLAIVVDLQRESATAALENREPQEAELAPAGTLADPQRIVEDLFSAFLDDPRMLPSAYRADDNQPRRVADYIAGMTDRYAMKEHRRLFAIGEI